MSDSENDLFADPDESTKLLLFTYLSVKADGGLSYVQSILTTMVGIAEEHTYKITQKRAILQEHAMNAIYTDSITFTVVAEITVSMLNTTKHNNKIMLKLLQNLNQLGLELQTYPISHECDIPLLGQPNTLEVDEEDDIFETYKKYGVVIIEDAVHMAIMNPIKKKINSYISTMLATVGERAKRRRGDVLSEKLSDHSTASLGLPDTIKKIEPLAKIKFAEIMERGNNRYDICLNSNNDFMRDFLDFATESAPWLNVGGRILNNEMKFVRCGVVVSVGGESSTSQHWHADGVESMMEQNAMCVFLPLMQLSEQTGYTSFWTGTHLHPQSDLTSNNVVDSFPPGSLTKGVASVGDVIMYDYKTIHRGEKNNLPEGQRRPILYCVYGVDSFEETNFSARSIFDSGLNLNSNSNLISNEQKFEIRSNPRSGRSMWATNPIKFGDVIHVAPALLIPKDEYNNHGSKTILR